jgi:hypothetical protein
MVHFWPKHLHGEAERLVMPQSLEQLSMAAVRACHLNEGFVRPAYDDFCFSGIPGFIEHTLTGSTNLRCFPQEVLSAVGRFDHVVFVFFDAFGWESFQRFRDSSPFLEAIDRDGIVMQTTSQFPSTTAAHVITAQSGQAAFEHQVCGWEYYEPNVGKMIKPLPFSFCDQPSRDSLLRAGFSPEQVLPSSNFIPNLMRKGVSVRFHGPEAFYPSSFGKQYAPVESLRGFASLAEGVDAVLKTFSAKPVRSYQMLYHDAYDVVCHGSGVGSSLADTVAQKTLKDLERLLSLRGNPRTLLLVSADHGQIKEHDDGAVAINHVMPTLEDLLKRDLVGSPIFFSGGKRHLCLHPRSECEDFVVHELRAKLAGAADVLTLDQMFQAGLLGPFEASPSFVERLGSVAVLPKPGFSVYWDKPGFGRGDPSSHGGVSPQEMETPLLLMRLG